MQPGVTIDTPRRIRQLTINGPPIAPSEDTEHDQLNNSGRWASSIRVSLGPCRVAYNGRVGSDRTGECSFYKELVDPWP